MDGKVNILLVDDRPDKLLALEAVLEDLGQNIVRAYSGREALRAVLDDEFAVILLDVNMPGMDGFETASLIRQRKNNEHVPIIFITAFHDDMHVARGYSLGAVDYITAPVVPEVLRTKVSVFVDLFIKNEQVQRQADALRRRAVQLQKLAAASVAVHSANSIGKLLQTVTDTARDLIGSHQAITLFVAEPAAGARPPRVQAVSSFSERYAPWRTRRLQLDHIATTLVAHGSVTVRMTAQELLAHPDWQIVRDANIPPIQGGMVAAPLLRRMREGNMGVIYVADRTDGPFTHDDEAILVQLAQMTSTAIENMVFAEERETNRIKDEFLATLSHELRTPLNAIMGWTQLLRLESLPPDALHGVEVIERNARAQTKLIEDLLDISRITTGKLRLSIKKISMAEVVRAALDVVRPAAESKQIALAADISPGGDAISGDADRLQQVVWNLLSNAVKFTPAGGIVSVSLGAAADVGQPRIQVQVKDSGLGIRPEFLPFVFDRFRQADSTSTRSHGGLGIGLTVVRHVVELHGGEVLAESDGDGKGSTFIVRLPREARGAHNHNGLAASKPQGSTARAEHFTQILDVHILVVDDESDAREVLARLLVQAGARVSQASSVREAIKMFHRAGPELLISDIAMPDEDGYDLIRELRKLPASEGGKVPAIAVTAYAREEDRKRALAAGFQAHVAKPIQPNEMLLVVEQLVQLNEQRDGGRLAKHNVASP